MWLITMKGKKPNILLHINLCVFFKDLNNFICYKKKHLQLGMKNAVSQRRENKFIEVTLQITVNWATNKAANKGNNVVIGTLIPYWHRLWLAIF